MKAATVVDLSRRADASVVERCDVCIVGAGAAGSYLCRRLAEAGLDVVLLEAGGRKGSGPLETGFGVEYLDAPYPAASEGRSFGLGGSTSRWGGLLVPHSRHDLRESQGDPENVAWRHIVDVAGRQGAPVLGHLGFRDAPAFEEFSRVPLGEQHEGLEAAGLDVVTSLFLPFRKKNLFHLLEGPHFSERAPRIYTHAVARDWRVNSSDEIEEVGAVSRGGGRVEVAADRFVIAAGAIESARMLFEVERSMSSSSGLSEDLGYGLGDHLSVAIADVEPTSLPLATDRYGPRFVGGWMRSFRFMDSAPGAEAPRAFSHFVFENENAGFRLAKNVLTAMQARRFPRVSPTEVVAGVSGVVGLAQSRFLRSRLFVPSDTPTRLQIDVEQVRSRRNRIKLGEEVDRHGRSIASIQWSISDEDIRNLRAASERLLSGWGRQSHRLPSLVPRDLSFDSEKPHDAYHPVGVCRMGADEESVVDLGLHVRGLTNAFVVSTAVLPSAGTANPTFTMLCLAEELLADLG